MYNKPAGTIGNVTIGPGILYLGVAGATPTIDVGYVTGDATLKFDRQKLEIRQGSPQTLIAQFAKQEDYTLEVKGIEWNLNALMRALGDGATSVSGASDIFKVGAGPAMTGIALQYVHKMSDGGTLTLNMWKVLPDGTVESSINAEKPHELKLKFIGMDPGSTDWGSGALTDGQKMLSLTRTRP